jgi:uncharacterized coiled-coil protein SlyX
MAQENSESIRIELESKIAFQEKAIADLNDALVDQARIIIELQRRVESLENVVRRLNHRIEVFDEMPANEKPPHY